MQTSWPSTANKRNKRSSAHSGVPYLLRLSYNCGSLEDYKTAQKSPVINRRLCKKTLANQFKKTTEPPRFDDDDYSNFEVIYNMVNALSSFYSEKALFLYCY